jgi:hypothetical protein
MRNYFNIETLIVLGIPGEEVAQDSHDVANGTR